MARFSFVVEFVVFDVPAAVHKPCLIGAQLDLGEIPSPKGWPSNEPQQTHVFTSVEPSGGAD